MSAKNISVVYPQLIFVADYALHEAWKELRNDACTNEMKYVRGMIDILLQIDILTPDQCELWQRRIETCPGHDDEGGRSWCAYCGNMPRDEEEGTE